MSEDDVKKAGDWGSTSKSETQGDVDDADSWTFQEIWVQIWYLLSMCFLNMYVIWAFYVNFDGLGPEFGILEQIWLRTWAEDNVQ